MSWKQVTAAKREQVSSQFPPSWMFAPDEVGGRMKRKNVIQLLTEHTSATEREISELPVPLLLQKLQQGDLSASEVVVR